jgi:threonine dehydrogenase-like Zn-dependent dehydrogenase
MLIALVCRAIGAEVLVSEINPHRLSLLRKMGIDTVDPSASDIEQVVADRTGGIGADVVFEVTGTEAGARTMTQLPSVRGRIVVVGIFSEAPAVDLFQFFWSELELLGARVYEAEDFDRAISLAASGTLPLDKLISKVVRLEDLEDAFREIDTGADLMKVLVKCSD